MNIIRLKAGDPVYLKKDCVLAGSTKTLKAGTKGAIAYGTLYWAKYSLLPIKFPGNSAIYCIDGSEVSHKPLKKRKRK